MVTILESESVGERFAAHRWMNYTLEFSKLNALTVPTRYRGLRLYAN